MITPVHTEEIMSTLNGAATQYQSHPTIASAGAYIDALEWSLVDMATAKEDLEIIIDRDQPNSRESFGKLMMMDVLTRCTHKLINDLNYDIRVQKRVQDSTLVEADHCVHGTFVGDPYGPDYLCGQCEDGEFEMPVRKLQLKDHEKKAIQKHSRKIKSDRCKSKYGIPTRAGWMSELVMFAGLLLMTFGLGTYINL